MVFQKSMGIHVNALTKGAASHTDIRVTLPPTVHSATVKHGGSSSQFITSTHAPGHFFTLQLCSFAPIK